MKLYIAGPMSGYPEHGAVEFGQAKTMLERAGYEVINPADEPPDPDRSWEDWIRIDIKHVISVDGIAVLPDWECSRGASLEVYIAKALFVPVLPVNVWVNRALMVVSTL